MINTNFNNTYINKNNIAKKDQVSFGKIFAIKYKIDGKYVKLNDPNNGSFFNANLQYLLEKLKPQNNLFKEDLLFRETLSNVADDYITSEKYFSEFERVSEELNYSPFDYFMHRDEISNKVNEKLNFNEYSSDVGTLCVDPSNNRWLFMTGKENFIIQAMFNIRKNINALWGEKIEKKDILKVDTCDKIIKETGIALGKILNDENSWVKGKEVLVIESERDKVHTAVVNLKNISFEPNSNIRKELNI